MGHSLSNIPLRASVLSGAAAHENHSRPGSNLGVWNGVQRLDWFAIAVKPRHEKSVACVLKTKGYETFVPLRRHRRVARVSELPLFPGYVFSRFDLLKRLPIMTTPGVNRILGVGPNPIPLDPCEIESLQTTLDKALSVAALPFLQAGKKVRICHGPLQGVEGIVVLDRGMPRIVLSITLLQRSVLAEVDSTWLLPEEGRGGDIVEATHKGSKDTLRL
jgi:transcription antitermination factor NusG